VVQTTIVFELDPAERRRLREALEGRDFQYRPVAHAEFSARGEDAVATLYRSGKLVVQGRGAASFVERYLGRTAPSAAPAPAAAARDDGPLVGGDESGKGDYFGPLVVAVVRLGAGDGPRLRQGGGDDSKKLDDLRIRRLAPVLRESFRHAVRVVDPPEYNRLHAELGNVALILSTLYREVADEVAQPGDRVLIDQFSKQRGRLASAFRGMDVVLIQEHHAERSPAVAAASILAREAFLERLAELSEEYAVDLPKGAGPPVDRAGRRFLRIHGPGPLGRVAKLHFRTTQKIGAGRA